MLSSFNTSVRWCSDGEGCVRSIILDENEVVRSGTLGGENKRPMFVAIALSYKSSKAKADWNISISVCSGFGMSPFILRNSKELGHFVSVDVAAIPLSKLEILFSLKQSEQHVGHRYSWGENRDLLFSHWAQGEPRNIISKKCVRWSTGITKYDDNKWHSVGCGEHTARMIPCREDVPPHNIRMHFNIDSRVNISEVFTKGSFGKVITKSSKGRGEVLSMSTLVASGYLHSRLASGMNYKG